MKRNIITELKISLMAIVLYSCTSDNNNKDVAKQQIIEQQIAQNSDDLKKNDSIVNDSNSTTKEYLNKKLRFKISYPKEWTLIEGVTNNPPSVMSIIRDPNNRQDPLNLTLTVGSTSEDKEAFYEENIKQILKERPDVKVLKKKKVTINSYDCYTTIMEIPALNQTMKLKQFLFIENGFSYYFVFTSDKARYESNVGKFEQIVMTFRIL